MTQDAADALKVIMITFVIAGLMLLGVHIIIIGIIAYLLIFIIFSGGPSDDLPE